MDSYFSRKQRFEVKNILMDLFQFLSSPDVNCWTGVVWIIEMFYQLFGLILTAPIHYRGYTGEEGMEYYISSDLFP